MSIAIGFALETTIKNMISGIFLLTNKKNKLGDTVEILGKFQLRGRIESITLRHTTIRTKDNRRVLIPNGELADTPIKTFKNETIMRGLLQVRVPRHSNIDQVRQLIIQTINANDFVQDKNYTTALISNFDAYGIVIKSFYYLNPSAGKTDFVINSEIRTQLSKLFKKYGIQTPYLNVVVDVD
ncbi:MAG: mechanosensitive ion channel [bacterium]|nr:mechanosensitive ion channel [bacterium]